MRMADLMARLFRPGRMTLAVLALAFGSWWASEPAAPPDHMFTPEPVAALAVALHNDAEEGLTALAYLDGAVNVLNRGELVGRIGGHGSPVISLAFTDQGRALVTVDAAGVTRFTRLASLGLETRIAPGPLAMELAQLSEGLAQLPQTILAPSRFATAPMPRYEATSPQRDGIEAYGQLEFKLVRRWGPTPLVPLTEAEQFEQLLGPSLNYSLLMIEYDINGSSLPPQMLLLAGRGKVSDKKYLVTSWWRLQDGDAFTFRLIFRAASDDEQTVLERLYAFSGSGASSTLLRGSEEGMEDLTINPFQVRPIAITMAEAIAVAFPVALRRSDPIRLGPGVQVRGGRFVNAARIYLPPPFGGFWGSDLTVRLNITQSRIDPWELEASTVLPDPGSAELPASPLLPRLRVLERHAPFEIRPLEDMLDDDSMPELRDFRREGSSTAANAERFDRACASLHQYALSELGLTETDALRLRWEALRPGVLAPELRASDCVREALASWRRMRYPVDQALAPAAVSPAASFLGGAEIGNLASILRGGGNAAALTARLSDRVAISDTPGGLGPRGTRLQGNAAVLRERVVAGWLAGKASEVGCSISPNPVTGAAMERSVLFLPRNPRQGLMNLLLRGSPPDGDGRVTHLEVTAATATEAAIRARCQDNSTEATALIDALAARRLPARR